MNPVVEVIDGAQEILGICPCCGDIFRFVEAKLLFPKRRVRSSEYVALLKLEAQVAEAELKLERDEERFQNGLERKREGLRQTGREQAKRKLKHMDPVFSGRNVDPQDVRVIFDPVEYVVFHGLNTGTGLEQVELVSRAPTSKADEMVSETISKAVLSGNVEFETLQLCLDGAFKVEKAKSA